MHSKTVYSSTIASIVAGAAMAFASPAILAREVITLQMASPNVPGDTAWAASLGLPADSIEVLSLSGGVENLAGLIGGGGGGSVSTAQDFVVTKRIGLSTGLLFVASAVGQHYTSATISFYHVVQNVATKYYSIVLMPSDKGGVSISADALNGSEGTPGTPDLEKISIHYDAIMLIDEIAHAPLGYDFARRRRI